MPNPYDSDNDGKADLMGLVIAAPSMMSAATNDILRVIAAFSAALGLALTLWNTMHPAAAVPVPTTGPVTVPALPDAPKAPEPPADTDAPTPAPVDAVAPVGGAS